MSTRTLAIVTRRQDFQESSRLVQLITRDYGRRTFLAKGAHRPKSVFLGAIDLLHVGEASVQVREGRGIQIVYSLRVLQGNQAFRRDSLRRSLALATTDFVRLAMPEGRPDADLFDLLRGALTLFGRAERRFLATIDTGIRLRLLAALGLLPDPTACPRTGEVLPRRGNVGFSLAHGGFVADAERRVPATLSRLAADLLELDGRSLGSHRAPAQPLRQLHGLTSELLRWHLAAAPRVEVGAALFAPGGKGLAQE